jgi:hypothetical protein
MTQQYQTRTQRITMLIALLALVIVIAKNVTAGTRCVVVKQQVNAEEPVKKVKHAIITLASEIEDIPWSPFITLFR